MRGKKKGITLIEMVVGVAIFAIIGMLVYTIFYNTFHSTRGGTLKVRAREDARIALSKITDELRTAVCPPSNSSFTPQTATSAVLSPAVSSPFIEKIDTSKSTGAGTDANEQGLIFVKTTLTPSNYSFFSSDLNYYSVIRYYVPFANKNQLRRIIYPLNSFSSSCLSANKNWTIADISSYAGVVPQESVVIELPDPKDTITLMVSHVNPAVNLVEATKVFRVTVVIKRAVWTSKMEGKDKEVVITSAVHIIDQSMENY